MVWHRCLRLTKPKMCFQSVPWDYAFWDYSWWPQTEGLWWLFVSYPERSSKGRGQWFIERGFRALGKSTSRIAALLLILLWKAFGWGEHANSPAGRMLIEPLPTNTCTCFAPKRPTRELSIFTGPAWAFRPTRLSRFGILWVNIPFHPILKTSCDQKSVERGFFMLLAPLRRSFCFLEPGVCLCPFRLALARFGFGKNQISRIDTLTLSWCCPQIKPLVLFQIFWKNSKSVRFYTNSVWFSRFSDVGQHQKC